MNKALVSLSASLCDQRAHPAQHWTCGRGLCFAMLIWLWTMETFASSVSCWLANREGESTNMWNCKKGKFYYLEQILKTTETGKVLTCESERSKQLKSESFTLGTDQYKNIPLSSVTTVSSNHANVSPWRPLPRECQSPFLQFFSWWHSLVWTLWTE